jgi:NAD(P)-dependent dehydrogenase (short-subunit alcohol dehydrogenase family)
MAYAGIWERTGFTLKWFENDVNKQRVQTERKYAQLPRSKMTTKRRIVLVTGAARGIGAAITSRLLREGRLVLAADLADRPRSPGEKCRIDVALDVTNAPSIAALREEVQRRWGRLDGLVNNAGIFARTPITTGPVDTEQLILAVNSEGPAAMIEAFAPLLERQPDAAIVNVASVRGLTAAENAAAYSVSKARVIDLTRAAALRFAGRIRCNAVAPGDIATGMTPPEPEIIAKLLHRIPLGRFGHPEEVASVVHFLLSPRMRAVNGAVLPVDGGFLAT